MTAPGAGSCHVCGARWSGFERQHCQVCCRTFNSTSAGDKHRVGDWTKTHPRRCMDEAEMVKAGMFARAGIWYGSRQDRTVDSHPAQPIETAEQDQGGVTG